MLTHHLLRPLSSLTKSPALFTSLFLFSTTRPLLSSLRNPSPRNPSLTFHSAQSFSTSTQPPNHPNHPYQNIQKGQWSGPGFYIQQLMTGCLSIYSYYIQSQNQAFLIDPMNQTAKYEHLLKTRGKKLKGVFLTHYHADYIAGHLDLQKKYGGDIYLGPKALDSFGIKVLKDGDILTVGSIKLRLLHTPGHTQQSSCIILSDANNKQQCIFTGDTVFLGQVGRPDLAVKTNLTSKDLASMLFDSLQKVKKLDNQLRVYPGHGAGSSCGKNISKGDYCTLGNQKQKNYGLKQTNKQKFIKDVLAQMPSPPAYFGHNAGINKFNPFDYSQAHSNVMSRLSPSSALQALSNPQCKLIDVRSRAQLNKGIIKGAVCIDYQGSFANWVGTLLPPNGDYIIYGSEQLARDSIERLLRIGYTNIRGYLAQDIKQLPTQFQVYKPQFVPTVIVPGRKIVDVRKPGEHAKGIIAQGEVILLQLSKLAQQHSKTLNKNDRYVLHCQSGYRSRIAYSMMKELGYDVVAFVEGGYPELAKMGIKTKIQGK